MIITALAGGSSEVAAASAESFTKADVYALQNALPARPTGQRGALLWFRTGSDAVVDNAFPIRLPRRGPGGPELAARQTAAPVDGIRRFLLSDG